MCTDVDRNDKSRICEAGSVQVSSSSHTGCSYAGGSTCPTTHPGTHRTNANGSVCRPTHPTQ